MAAVGSEPYSDAKRRAIADATQKLWSFNSDNKHLNRRTDQCNQRSQCCAAVTVSVSVSVSVRPPVSPSPPDPPCDQRPTAPLHSGRIDPTNWSLMLSSVLYSTHNMDNLPQHPPLDPRKQELLEARFTGSQRVGPRPQPRPRSLPRPVRHTVLPVLPLQLGVGRRVGRQPQSRTPGHGAQQVIRSFHLVTSQL